jgi:hypothetical protein
VGEALNEVDPSNSSIGLRVIVRHKLLLENSDEEQRLAEEMFWHPVQEFLAVSQHFGFERNASTLPAWKSVPLHFQVNFRPSSPLHYVLRLRNMLDIPQTLDLSKFLSPLHGRAFITEAGLSENQPMEEVIRNHLHWSVIGETEEQQEFTYLEKTDLDKESIDLQFNPYQVRSFFLDLRDEGQLVVAKNSP